MRMILHFSSWFIASVFNMEKHFGGGLFVVYFLDSEVDVSYIFENETSSLKLLVINALSNYCEINPYHTYRSYQNLSA